MQGRSQGDFMVFGSSSVFASFRDYRACYDEPIKIRSKLVFVKRQEYS